MQKPDYVYLIKLDSWSKKTAALVISGLDPENYRHIRFIPKELNYDLYPELREPYRLFRLFNSINFYDHGRYHSDPLTYIHICLKKEWPIPDELLNLAKIRYEKEIASSAFEDSETSPTNIEDNSKEKNYLLKSLAVMAMLYVTKQKSPRLGTLNQINVAQVTEDVLQFLEEQDLSIYGIGKSSFHKRISEGIRLIFREGKKENCLAASKIVTK